MIVNIRMPADVIPMACPCGGGANVHLGNQVIVVSCSGSGCERSVSIPVVVPPNCHSQAMLEREISKHIARGFREWNISILSPNGGSLIVRASVQSGAH